MNKPLSPDTRRRLDADLKMTCRKLASSEILQDVIERLSEDLQDFVRIHDSASSPLSIYARSEGKRCWTLISLENPAHQLHVAYGWDHNVAIRPCWKYSEWTGPKEMLKPKEGTAFFRTITPKPSSRMVFHHPMEVIALTLLLKLRRAVRQAPAVGLAPGKSIEEEKGPVPATPPAPKLLRSWKTAYDSLEWIAKGGATGAEHVEKLVERHPDGSLEPTDKAWKYLKENGCPQYEDSLPSKDSWKRYCRAARQALHGKINHSRSGREARGSVVTADQIEPSALPTCIQRQGQEED